MNYRVLLVGLLLAPLASSAASAYYCEGGQQPVPPAVAQRMALPLCGIGATQPWGPNGCQLCDTRNMYPSPFALPNRARAHTYHD
jgi:hypothetical protein